MRPSEDVSSSQQSTFIYDDTSTFRRGQQAGRGRGREGASTSKGGNKRPKIVGFDIYTDDISGGQTLNVSI